MAFNTGAQRNNSVRPNSNGQDDSWKAQGFLNIALKRANGVIAKFGFLALKESDAVCKWLMSVLDKDPSQATKVMANMVLEYRSTALVEGTGLEFFGGKVIAATERPATEGQAEKPHGYLNFSLLTEDGVKCKVGSIALMDSVPFEKQVAEALDSDPTQIDALKAAFIVDYRTAAPVSKKAMVFKLV